MPHTFVSTRSDLLEAKQYLQNGQNKSLNVIRLQSYNEFDFPEICPLALIGCEERGAFGGSIVVPIPDLIDHKCHCGNNNCKTCCNKQ